MSGHKLSKRLLTLSAAVSLLLCQSAFAGETVELNLQDAMERAFNTNPAITISGYERDSARANYNAARQSRGITISANHSTQRSGYDDNVVRKTNPDGFWTGEYYKAIGNTHSNSLTASIPIYTGGKLSGTVKQAKANYLYTVEGVQKAYNDMRSTVTNGYFDMLQAGNMQDLGRESVEQLADHLKNVEAQYEVGVVAKVDVLRSQVELANAKQTLIQYENNYQIAEANLNKIVGLPMDTQLKLDNILVYTPYDKDLEACLNYASEHRPELEQAKQNVEAAKGALRVAISGHMPQVTASASQNWNNTNWPGDENGNWDVRLNVNWNLFDTGVTNSRIHGAEADLAKAHETYRDKVDSVNLDVRTNYLSLREAEKRIDATHLAVDQADEDYRIAQLRYMNGVGTNTDVLDAQVALTTAKTNYLQALYDYNTSKTSLETAIGVPMAFPTKISVEAPKTEQAEAGAEKAAE
ncbi:TolC family protein [uncultured Phascolarctobacterium sp.]|uniref:TolC family protein n=1 Tax=uncultured Phascolarctobacterium sp. TaxID=512296 RepID=UPI0025E5C454|nr:TolC family protein [uncultured Phascolarctobacterium sp.]